MLYKNTGGGVGYGGKTGGKENKDLVPDIKFILVKMLIHILSTTFSGTQRSD